ncbi:HAE1 family hydrophobic/amphiphilic exporter-1 [Melghiribacillus thermohalophilus]|uniref:HAE1 family hydrophobic/amphiphilic exporter-1 n=1 Tax=Melghiribacillus thermohalophilus TaxID=1324956 RepID=A0A4R3NCF4_9BACI|nr:efflux RND transporter permease subunit [Melghiribacillus thermohalophilus]TCT26441.1 HAE1 family hydrophobic/amphiphilic exporter-1 [Melghiribacillus thermohalophilus]
MKLVDVSVRRPVGVTMLVIAILALGFVSLRNLVIDLYPDIELPIAVVSTSYEGAAPQEVENLVSRPIESAVSTIEGIDTVQTQSQPGASLVVLMFNNGVDLDQALLDVRESVDRVKGFLPENAGEPNVLKFDPQQVPIMWLGLKGTDSVELQRVAEDRIVPFLERQEGVGSVSIEGGREQVIHVVLKQEQLFNYGLNASSLAQAINAANQSASAGVIDKGDQDLQIRIQGEYESVEEIEKTLIQTPAGEQIYLKDVADIEETFKEQNSLSIVNGEPAVVLSILKKSEGNTVQVADEINEAIKEIRPELSDEISLDVVFDTSIFVRQAIDSVVKNMLAGAVFSVFVLLLFLKSFRATIVIGLSIPIAIISTFTLMYFTGETLNVLTMGGLALGIGMMVDSSIVILEHIVSYRQQGYSLVEAAKKGGSELAPAVIASTTTTLVVFLPIVFVEGLASELFTPLAMTVSFALIASLVVSITLIPMLSSKLLKKSFQTQGRRYWFDRLMEKVYRVYRSMLSFVLKHRKTTVFTTLLLIAASLSLIPMIGTSFIPESDQGQLEIRVTAPEGTSMEATRQITEEVDEKIKKYEDIMQTNYLSIAGGGFEGFGGSANRATYTIQLIPPDEREITTQEVVANLDEELQKIPGAEIVVSEMSAGLGTGDPVQIKLNGPDYDVLTEIADQVVYMISDIEGVQNPESSASEGRPEIQVEVNQDLAGEYGLTQQQVMSQVQLAFNGQTVTRYRTGGDEIDVRLVLPEEKRQSIEDLETLLLQTATGQMIPLSAVAELKQVTGPVALNRENQQRQVNVTSDIAGRDLGSITADIENRLENMNFPEGYSYTIGGQAEDMLESFQQLALALVFSIFLVYAVMAIQFENYLYPFVIMFSMPATVIGVLLGLFVTQKPLSLPAFVGVIMLAGIVVNNAIVLVDYINILRRRGIDRYEAIMEAGPSRLRPILMTTLTTVLGMVPLALGWGQGAEAQQPLAIVIIFGLTVSMIFTLLLIPVVYTYFDDLPKLKGKVAGLFRRSRTNP